LNEYTGFHPGHGGGRIDLTAMQWMIYFRRSEE